MNPVPRPSPRRNSTAVLCADVFRAVGDATRLGVLQELLKGPARVGELMERLEVEQSLLSHHLKVLRDAGLVLAERDGKAVRYRVAPEVRDERQEVCLDLDCCRVVFRSAPVPKPKRHP